MTNWTDEQETVIEQTVDGRGNMMVNAVAGSGKTSVIVEGARRWNGRYPGALGLACAFNKDIALVLKERLPRSFNCSTLHSHGLRAFKGFLGKKTTVEKFKPYMCLEEVIGPDDWKNEEIEAIKGDLKRGLDLIRSGVIRANEYERSIEKELLMDTLDHQAIFFENDKQTEWAIEKILDAMELSIKLALSEGVIDFTDMLFMPVFCRAEFDKFDLVLLDESQDVSGLQLEMVRQSIKPRGRLIAVGDRAQAIYGWRGADDSSMDRIAREFNCDEFPMTFTFRCPQSVTTEAQQVVPSIRCPDSAPEGSVQKVKGDEIFDEIEDRKPSELAVLCRNRKPLIDLAFRMRRRGLVAVVLGSDLGITLTAMIRKWKADTAIEIERQAQLWMDVEREKAMRRHAWDAVQAIEDKGECLIAICENLPSNLPKKEVIEEIRNLFSDDKRDPNAVVLSTIHRAKGLEWKTVFFYYPHLIPNKYCQLPWQFKQEENLRYVAITRALDTLIYVEESERSELGEGEQSEPDEA